MTRITPAATLAAFLMAATPALADTTVSFAPLANVLIEYLAPVLGALIVALIGWLATRLNRWFGIEIEARHREALHSAAITGVNLALQYLHGKSENLTLDLHSAIVANGVRWVQQSVPDALKHFRLTPQQLASLVASKIPAGTGEQASIPAP